RDSSTLLAKTSRLLGYSISYAIITVDGILNAGRLRGATLGLDHGHGPQSADQRRRIAAAFIVSTAHREFAGAPRSVLASDIAACTGSLVATTGPRRRDRTARVLHFRSSVPGPPGLSGQ